jgi:hypothetical protein
VDMASNGLFWRFWSYIVSEIQNEKTASSRPSLLLGVGPRGPLEVDPAMGWLSSSSPFARWRSYSTEYRSRR